MAHHNKSKRSKAKTILRLPDSEQSRQPYFIHLGRRVHKNPTVTPSTNSSAGIAPNRG